MTPVDKIKAHLETSKVRREKALTQLSVEAAFDVVNHDTAKDKVIEKLVDALEKYKKQGRFIPYDGSNNKEDYGFLAHETIAEVAKMLEGDKG